jgi:N-acetylglutamate synthase-like GNAT family acetyltransferase
VEALLQEPVLQGVERTYLMTTNSVGFYEKLGFTEVEEQKTLSRERLIK